MSNLSNVTVKTKKGDKSFKDFTYASEFKEGFALLEKTVEHNGKEKKLYAIIDEDGNFINDSLYKSVSVSNKHFIVSLHDRKNLVNASGKELLNWNYKDIVPFQKNVPGHGDTFLVASPEGKWGILNEFGKIILIPQFENKRTAVAAFKIE